jgi:hypothetical protein
VQATYWLSRPAAIAARAGRRRDRLGQIVDLPQLRRHRVIPSFAGRTPAFCLGEIIRTKSIPARPSIVHGHDVTDHAPHGGRSIETQAVTCGLRPFRPGRPSTGHAPSRSLNDLKYPAVITAAHGDRRQILTVERCLPPSKHSPTLLIPGAARWPDHQVRRRVRPAGRQVHRPDRIHGQHDARDCEILGWGKFHKAPAPPSSSTATESDRSPEGKITEQLRGREIQLPPEGHA